MRRYSTITRMTTRAFTAAGAYKSIDESIE
jgi:hypothetical protein